MATLSAGLRMKRFPAFSSQRSARRNSRLIIILYLQQKASIFCYACLCSTIGRKSLLKSRNLLLRQPGILRNDIDWNAGVFEIHDTTWKAMKASIIHKIAALVGNLSLVIGILCLIVSLAGTGW